MTGKDQVKTSRSDWKVASAWLEDNRGVTALIASLAAICAVALMVTGSSTGKRAIGIPLFAGMAIYLGYRAVRAKRQQGPKEAKAR